MSAKNAGGADAGSPGLIDADTAIAMAKLAEVVVADNGPSTTCERDREH